MRMLIIGLGLGLLVASQPTRAGTKTELELLPQSHAYAESTSSVIAEPGLVQVNARGNILDVPIIVEAGDGQFATCWSARVKGLNPKGDGFLAIRSGPGSDYRKIGQLYNGYLVCVVEMRGKWAGVIYGSDTGEACNSRRSYELQHPKRGLDTHKLDRASGRLAAGTGYSRVRKPLSGQTSIRLRTFSFCIKSVM